MVPFGLSQEQFARRYRRELDRVSSSAIDRIQLLLATDLPLERLTAKVEVFVGEDGAAPAVWVYYRGENNRVNHKDERIFAGRSMNLELNLQALSNFAEEYFGHDYPGTFIAANVLKSWFAECWWKAGGWSYVVPSELHVHDDRGNGEYIQLTASAA